MHFFRLPKGEVIKAGSILGGSKGNNESTSPERGDPPDTSTEPLDTREKRSPPSYGISEAAEDSKLSYFLQTSLLVKCLSTL